MLTYYSSYLKCHYPAAFFAALINSQPMGFYSPRQLLEAAKRQEVEVLPVDINISHWECTLERINDKHAIRLGLCLVRGLAEADANRIVAARSGGLFSSADDIAHRARLSTRIVKILATAGALRSISTHRHAAIWNAMGVEKPPGILAGHAAPDTTPVLPAPTTWQEMIADYRHLGLSDRHHPLKLLRPLLQRQGICSRKDLDTIANGSTVTVCGLVTHLQHPQTANGVVFSSLEDEHGIHNIIFWPKVFDACRYVLLTSTLIAVTGKLQNQEGVINVIAERAADYSHHTPGLERHSRDFQ